MRTVVGGCQARRLEVLFVWGWCPRDCTRGKPRCSVVVMRRATAWGESGPQIRLHYRTFPMSDNVYYVVFVFAYIILPRAFTRIVEKRKNERVAPGGNARPPVGKTKMAPRDQDGAKGYMHAGNPGEQEPASADGIGGQAALAIPRTPRTCPKPSYITNPPRSTGACPACNRAGTIPIRPTASVVTLNARPQRFPCPTSIHDRPAKTLFGQTLTADILFRSQPEIDRRVRKGPILP